MRPHPSRVNPEKWSFKYAHLESLAPEAVRLVNEYIRATTHGNPPRSLFKGYSFEFIGIVDIDRLEERLRTAEDDQRVAGNVRLLNAREGQGQRIQLLIG